MLERIHLAIVQEVDRQGSLTAAALTLHVTQSALSHSMKKLEQQLGIDIWLREGRSLRLTQAGQYLLAVANRVLPQLDLAEDRLQQFAQGERGTLRIGMECHPCYQWLLKVVSPYLAAWPDVDVDVKQKFQFGGIGALVLMAYVTVSGFTDAGGPVDWLLVGLIWGGGLVGTTILSYALMGLLRTSRSH